MPRILTQDKTAVQQFIGALAQVPLDKAPSLDCWWMLLREKVTIHLYGSIGKLWASLVRYNNDGWSIYTTVNEFAPATFDESGKINNKPKNANCLRVRANFVDIDEGELPKTFPLLPDSVVQTTEPGLVVEAPEGKRQYLWFTSTTDFTEAVRVNKALAAYYGSDDAVTNIGRYCRVPGFFNRKPGTNCLVVQDYLDPDACHSLDEHIHVVRLEPSELKPLGKGRKNIEGIVKQFPSHELASAEYLRLFGNPSRTRLLTATKELSKQMSKIKRGNWAGRRIFLVAMAHATYIPNHEQFMAVALPVAKTAMACQDEARGRTMPEEEIVRALHDGHQRGLEVAIERAKEDKRKIAATVIAASDFIGNIQETSIHKLMQENKIVVVKSPPGTGKTQALSEAIAALPANAEVLVVTHRIALVMQSLKALGGFLKYDEEAARRQAWVSRLVTTFDSLHKLIVPGMVINYDYVILDEADAGLAHLFTSRDTEVNITRKRAIDAFKAALVNCKSVVMLGADIQEFDLDVVKALADTSEAAVLHNQVQAPLEFRKTFEFVPTKATAIARIEKALAEGLKVFVTMDTRGDTEDLYHCLSKQFPNLRGTYIHSKHKSHFSDVEDLYAYDFVIASPSLGTGFDISKKHFDLIVGIFTNHISGIGYIDLNQALARCRQTKQAVVFVDGASATSSPTDARIIQEFRLGQEEVSKTLLTEYNISTGRYEMRPFEAQVVQWQAKFLARKLGEACSRRAKLILALEADGHTIVVEPEVEECKSDIAEAKEERKLREAKAIAQAPIISSSELNNLPKLNRTPEQQASVESYFMRLDMELDEQAPTEEQALWYGTDNSNGSVGKRVCRHQKLLRLSEEEAIARNVRDIEAKEGLEGDVGSKRVYERWQALTALAAHMPKPEQTYSVNDLEQFHKAHQKHQAVVKDCFGISFNSNKATASQALQSFARLLGYKREALGNIRVEGGRERIYKLVPTPELSALLERMQAKADYTPDYARID